MKQKPRHINHIITLLTSFCPKICIKYRKHGNSFFSHTFNCVCLHLFLGCQMAAHNLKIYISFFYFFSINKKTLLNILDTFHVKSWKNLKHISLDYVLPSDRTLDILKIGVGTHNWMYVRKKSFHVSCTWYKSLV